MKRSKTTTIVLTCSLLFMFALFGGGTLLNALGIISIPFFSSSAENTASSSNGQNPVTSDIYIPGGIQIYDPQMSESSQDAIEDTVNSVAVENANTEKDYSYKAELSGSTGSSLKPVDKTGNTSSTNGQGSGGSGSSGTGSASGSPPSHAGTPLPSSRPKSSEPSSGGGSSSVSVQSVTLDQTEVTINRKNTLQLTVTITPQNATNKKISWATSNKDVATVDSTGKVTGIGAGTVMITATAGQKSATCEVSVVVLMDGIVLNQTDLAINKGSTEQLTAKITPEDTTEEKDIIWSSSDPEIVSVDSDGKVTALKTGKAFVKASAVGASASCEVTVLSPMIGIELDKSTLTLNRNTTDQLTISFLPVDTTDGRTVTWSSSAPEIADVDQQGNVVAHGIGTAKITASCGEFSASCDVTVIALIEGIYLDQPEMTIDRGTDGQLTASIVPLDTTDDKTVTWTSSDPDVATVDSTGNVTALKIGTATITAQVGEHTASCSVTVVALIHSISLNMTELTLDRGTGDQLTLTIDPPDTTEDKTVTWSSSNPDVATVDTTGKVTSIKTGAVTITAKVGTHTASCSVTVVALIHNITLDKTELTLDRGTGDQLTLTIDPPDTTEDKTITWTSSNPDVAAIDGTGKVTALKIGSTTITAQVGEHTVSCSVTVVALIHNITLNKTELTLDRGTGDQLTLTIDPPDTTEDKTIIWSSSNPDVATVDETGKVTSIKIGEAIITAQVGEHTASCSVTVVALIHNITLDKTSIYLSKGGSEQLTVSFDPVDTTESKTVTWTSSSSAIATVDGTGRITAIGAGKIVISAQVGNKTATCDVTVGVGYSIWAGVTDYNNGIATLQSNGGCSFYVTPTPTSIPGGWTTDYTWRITFDRPITITQGQSLIEYLGIRSGIGYSDKWAYPVAYSIRLSALAKFTGDSDFYQYNNFYSILYSQDDDYDYLRDGNVGMVINANKSGQIRSLAYTFTFLNRTSYFTEIWNSIKIKGQSISGAPTGYLDL